MLVRSKTEKAMSSSKDGFHADRRMDGECKVPTHMGTTQIVRSSSEFGVMVGGLKGLKPATS